jgi:hypothetical protein
MTIQFARRNNKDWPLARPATLKALEARLHFFRMTSDTSAQEPSNLDVLTASCVALRKVMDHHDKGTPHYSAVDVYNAAISVAAQALRLAEEGTQEYRYASGHMTAAPDLFDRVIGVDMIIDLDDVKKKRR